MFFLLYLVVKENRLENICFQSKATIRLEIAVHSIYVRAETLYSLPALNGVISGSKLYVI